MKLSTNVVIAIVAVVASLFCCCTARAADALPSWNDGASKKAITDFVRRITTEGSSEFVPVAERIAVFDNDGTLWAEQPMYFQFAFALDRVKALAPQHPEWEDKEPFKSILAGDLKGLLAGGEKAIGELMITTHSGMTTQEFEKIVNNWLVTAKHPTTGKPYTQMVYQPMLELLAYLRESGFKTYIVSGGGAEFMRPWVERVYGIPPEQVVGSRGKYKFEMRDDTPVLVKLPDIDLVDDGPGKPVGIQQVIGRRPVMAFGNSDGDLQMLQWTTIPRSSGDASPRFGMLVHHTDAEREWAYDRSSHIGRLDKALDEATQRGWTVVNMKEDWKTIYPPAAGSGANAGAGAGAGAGKSEAITGSVAYRIRIALPPDAVVHVRLEDVSRADAPATLIAETRVATEGKQVPIPFTLSYDPAKIEPSHTYQVRATILSGDKTLFTSTQAYPVITRGAGREARILLEQVVAEALGGKPPAQQQQPAASTSLEGPRWRLVELNGVPSIGADAGGEGAGITFVNRDRTIAVNTGVNILGGSYTLSGSELDLRGGAMTTRAGPEPLMKQEQAYIDALKKVKSWRITGTTLELLDGATVVAKFVVTEP